MQDPLTQHVGMQGTHYAHQMWKQYLLAYPSPKQRVAYRKRNRAYVTQEQKKHTYVLLKATMFPLHESKEEIVADLVKE